jgi:hypothetical protein
MTDVFSGTMDRFAEPYKREGIKAALRYERSKE